jgi:alkyl hydroperoxide reductase subunit AhpC
MILRPSYFVFVLALFTACQRQEAASLDVVATGESAPSFTLTDINGQQHSLSDYTGKWVVLEWFNHGCPFVRKFYKPGKMQELQRQAASDGVVWLTIDSTNADHPDFLSNQAAKDLWQDWNMASTAMLMDSDGAVGLRYGATNTPQMFVINPDGVIVYQGAIDDKRSTDSDDIESAKNYVMAALDEARSGKTVTVATTKPYGCSVKYAD